MVREKEDWDEDQVSGVFQGLGQGSNSKDRIVAMPGKHIFLFSFPCMMQKSKTAFLSA